MKFIWWTVKQALNTITQLISVIRTQVDIQIESNRCCGDVHRTAGGEICSKYVIILGLKTKNSGICLIFEEIPTNLHGRPKTPTKSTTRSKNSQK
jgi:hypothetical protein